MEIILKNGIKIGDGHSTFIIAEVGSNWKTLSDCIISIEKAKECGADAVKFQLFDWNALYGVPEHVDNQLKEVSLPVGWLPILKDRADRLGIEFMCSAFSPELIDSIDPYVNIHKLASAETCHVRMLEKFRKKGKPVFMSMGGHSEEEIEKALTVVSPNRLLNGVLLYCVAAYPARAVNLGSITNFRNRFNILVGYSDHTLDVFETPVRSVQMGACVVEKHFTAIDAHTPDSPHSLNASQFRGMVNAIRNRQLVDYSREEEPMVLRHHRRLIAIKDIEVGDKFKEGENFGIYRSLKDAPHALSPFHINEVSGKKALKELKAGDTITREDL